MSYLFLPIVLLMLIFLGVAKIIVTLGKKEKKDNKKYSLYSDYIKFMTMFGPPFFLLPLVWSGLEIYAGYMDCVDRNELYSKIESAKGETMGYVYDYCNDKRCACYYYRIHINGKDYKGCAGVRYNLRVGDSIPVYYCKSDPEFVIYIRQYKRLYFWEHIDVLGIYGLFFPKKEENKG